MSRKGLVAAIGAAALLLVACGGGGSESGSDSAGASEQPSVSSPAGEAVGTPVTVKLGESDVSHQYMDIAPPSVPAGPVTFTIVNEGAKVHEFVILETPEMADGMEMKGDEVVEGGYTVVDEAEDVQPGTTATLTVDLPSGHYAMICNVKGHYRMGMFSDFQVA